MKKCPKCSQIYSDEKQYCRNCGTKLIKDNTKTIKRLVICIAVFVIISFIGYIKSSVETSREETRLNNFYKKNRVSPKDLRVTDWSVSHSNNYTYIKGSIKNIGENNVSYYKITSKYINEYTNEIEDSDYTNSAEDLASGESRKFEIMTEGKYEAEYIKLYIDEVH